MVYLRRGDIVTEVYSSLRWVGSWGLYSLTFIMDEFCFTMRIAGLILMLLFEPFIFSSFRKSANLLSTMVGPRNGINLWISFYRCGLAILIFVFGLISVCICSAICWLLVRWVLRWATDSRYEAPRMLGNTKYSAATSFLWFYCYTFGTFMSSLSTPGSLR